MWSLDLGAIGEHEAIVSWSGYRPAREAEDDCPTIELVSCVLDINGSLIDVLPLLSQDHAEDIKVEAWKWYD